jgi:hypothetical protein
MRFLNQTLIMFLMIFAFSCEYEARLNGVHGADQDPLVKQYSRLSQKEKDNIERFNVIANDIRDYPPLGKNIEDYFKIIKNVQNLEDAKIIFIGEDHTDSPSQIWSASLINRMIRKGDIVLFEGLQSGTPVDDVALQIISDIVGTREYEKRKSHRIYKPTSSGGMRLKCLLYADKIKEFLVHNKLNLKQGKGFFWDLERDELAHNEIERNEEMVKTIRRYISSNGRVFVIAGALHLPHYEFAKNMKFEDEWHARTRSPTSLDRFLSSPGAKRDEINMAYYDFWASEPNNIGTRTRVIFEFLKDQDFAVVLPKNLPGLRAVEKFLPKNAQ